MAEEGSPTPERELLKLIEEPGAKAGLSQAKAQRDFFSLFSPVALKARFSFLKERFKGEAILQSLIHLEFRTINLFVEICIFALIFYLISNFIVSMININKKSSLELEIKEITASSVLPETSLLKTASFYLEKARARDIFKMGITSVIDKPKAPKASTSRIVEASKNLKLVGISWSQDPDVIIEDTNLGMAYFLKRGQMINNLKVKAVFKDKVILSYEGEEVELR